jgi:hypothetical protein
VIWLVAMGEGVSYQAQQQIKDLGATSIIVRSIKPAEESSRSDSNARMGISYGLLREDYERIVTNVPTIGRAVPMREISREVRHREQFIDGMVIACTPEYFGMNRLTIARGRAISALDMSTYANVVVLAHEAAAKLFPIEDPLGRAVQIGQEFYVIIGIAAERSAAAAIGGSLDARQYDRDVYIPLTTFRARIGDRVFTSRAGSFQLETVELTQITAVVDDMKEVDSTADIIRALLQRYHKVVDYAVVVPKELLEQAETMRAMFNVLLLLIAGISLLVPLGDGGPLGDRRPARGVVRLPLRPDGERRSFRGEGLAPRSVGRPPAEHPQPRAAPRPLVDHRRLRHLRRCGDRVRDLPRPPGGEHGSDRGAPSRVRSGCPRNTTWRRAQARLPATSSPRSVGSRRFIRSAAIR